MRTALITGLTVAGLLTASIATPAAAVMPAYMKLGDIKGEAAQAEDTGERTAKPAKPERRTSRPNIAVGDLSGDGRDDSRKPGRRDVKPPSPKPTGLLLPAIQKGR
jgi:hypothetical protein